MFPVHFTDCAERFLTLAPNASSGKSRRFKRDNVRWRGPRSPHQACAEVFALGVFHLDQDHGTAAAWFTLGVAAKQAGVSKPTLSKAIKSGRISAEKQPDGSYRIQPAELFRVYRQPSPGGLLDSVDNAQETRLPAGEIEGLRERLALLTAERDREREQLTDQILDLRRRLDSETETRRQLTLLLTDQRQRAPRRRWWRRMFGAGRS
jgi:hypothetical protein